MDIEKFPKWFNCYDFCKLLNAIVMFVLVNDEKLCFSGDDDFRTKVDPG